MCIRDSIETILEAVKKAGYEPGKDFKIAMDAASSEWKTGKVGECKLPKAGTVFTSEELIAQMCIRDRGRTGYQCCQDCILQEQGRRPGVEGYGYGRIYFPECRMKGAAMKKIFSNYYKIILSVVILIGLVALCLLYTSRCRAEQFAGIVGD